MFLSIISWGAFFCSDDAFCAMPLHSARYDSVPHTGFVFELAGRRCFLGLLASDFICSPSTLYDLCS
jgi:hypothetical protein